MISQQVREFIIRNFYVSAPDQLADTDSLLDGGIIDSTGVLEVIGFIEDTFGFTVADAEMLPENLDSIAHIAAFIERKTAGRGTPA
jgi:acyl carrier protein